MNSNRVGKCRQVAAQLTYMLTIKLCRRRGSLVSKLHCHKLLAVMGAWKGAASVATRFGNRLAQHTGVRLG